jgi:hypothetical protein
MGTIIINARIITFKEIHRHLILILILEVYGMEKYIIKLNKYIIIN